MDATLTGQPKRKGFFTRLLERFAEKNFPKRFKRLIYVSSILAVIKQIKEPDEILITKLNELFKIAKYPDAMIFPMYIKTFIWRNVTIDTFIQLNGNRVLISDLDCQCFNEHECEAIGKFFVDNAPDWLQYGSKKLMTHDVVLLMRNLQDFNNKTVLA